MKKGLILILFSCLLTACSSLEEKRNERIRKNIQNIDALIIVHPTFYFDSNAEAKEAISFVSDFFINLKKPVFTLVETQELITAIHLTQASAQLPQSKYHSQSPSASNYLRYFPRIKETQLVQSLNGENKIKVSGKNIVIIGGYLLACLRTAVQHLSRHNLEDQSELNIYLPLRAIYGKDLNQQGSEILSKEGLQSSLNKWLPKETGYEVYRDEKLFLKVKENEPKILRIYVRPIKEGLFPLNQF